MRKYIEKNSEKIDNYCTLISFFIVWSLFIYMLVVHMDRDVWILIIFIIVVVLVGHFSWKGLKKLIDFKKKANDKSDASISKKSFSVTKLDQCKLCFQPIGRNSHIVTDCGCEYHYDCFTEYNTRTKNSRCPTCLDKEVEDIIEYIYEPPNDV